MGRGGEGGVGGVTGAFFFLGAAFLPFAIFVKMGARGFSGFSSSVGGAEERLEESDSSMMCGCCLQFWSKGRNKVKAGAARLVSRSGEVNGNRHVVVNASAFTNPLQHCLVLRMS